MEKPIFTELHSRVLKVLIESRNVLMTTAEIAKKLKINPMALAGPIGSLRKRGEIVREVLAVVPFQYRNGYWDMYEQEIIVLKKPHYAYHKYKKRCTNFINKRHKLENKALDKVKGLSMIEQQNFLRERKK